MAGGGREAGPCNKWLPVNTSVPSGEASDVLRALQAQAAQQLASTGAAALRPLSMSQAFPWLWDFCCCRRRPAFGFCVFPQGAQTENGFQSENVQNDLVNKLNLT